MDNAKVVELIKQGEVTAKEVTQEEKKLTRKERKQLHNEVISGLEHEIRVLEETLKKLPNSTDDYNQAVAEIKNLTEAYQTLTKNDTERHKSWCGVGAAVATAAIVAGFEFFKGPFMGKSINFIKKS